MKAEYYPQIKSSDEKVKLIDVETMWHKDDTIRLKKGSVFQLIDTDKWLIFITEKESIDDDVSKLEGDLIALKFNKQAYTAVTGWENKKPTREKIEPTIIEKEMVKAFNHKLLPEKGVAIKAVLGNATAEMVEDLNSIHAVIKWDENESPEQLIDPSIIQEVKKSGGGYSKQQTFYEIFQDRVKCFNECLDGDLKTSIFEKARSLGVEPWEVIKVLLS
ncbi:hypothetical protein PN466_00785 [Roseofilum reptotaenium CS-1145]|uniref:Uncharacterized protein n=1 Tax=Roseofilum reptotaenium AO1-A TaxID=1925591 RepID=A0A1L9QKM4_9CYAN|nr:hypothetical protein [Roseofilum reptotaenium]MDB9515497.1 hypothetical protein [Roseofilum reptotaenium CS-1145]OJJ16934.1 hypothetical protein BI308_23245 [Roseofilum reptotaenium AO1-A]